MITASRHYDDRQIKRILLLLIVECIKSEDPVSRYKHDQD